MSLSAPSKFTLREITLFSMLGTLVFCAQIAMEALPNVHLTGMFILLFTVVYRTRALIPLYIYVFLIGVRWGFGVSWIPYLYVWLFLWGAGMLLPKKMSPKVATFVYPAVCCLHGLLFGVLYAPAQALLFGFDLKTTLAWIAAGFVFDVTHGAGNLVAGFLILPLSQVLYRLEKRTKR